MISTGLVVDFAADGADMDDSVVIRLLDGTLVELLADGAWNVYSSTEQLLTEGSVYADVVQNDLVA